MLRFAVLVFLDSQRPAAHALRPPARGGMVVGTEVDGIGAQPLFLKMLDSKTHTFIVYFLSAELHEFTAAIAERLGKVPDVIMHRARRIDVVAEANKKLSDLGWAKECTVNAVLDEHEMAHGSPSESPGRSPDNSPPGSRPASPHLKPDIPIGVNAEDYLEKVPDDMLEQEGSLNLTAAVNADPNALGTEPSPEKPASYSPGSIMGEEAAAAGTTSMEVSLEESTPSPPEGSASEAAASRPAALHSAYEAEVSAIAASLIDARLGKRTMRDAALVAAADLVKENMALRNNLTDFTVHSAAIELYGMLGTNQIELSEFDVLYNAGVKKATGAGRYGNPDTTLGKQAGAALALELDRIFHKKGMAILKKCPMAAGWKGGVNSWGYCDPHPEYHILKRARLTTEDDAQPWNHEAWEEFSRNLLSHGGKSNESGDSIAHA